MDKAERASAKTKKKRGGKINLVPRYTRKKNKAKEE